MSLKFNPNDARKADSFGGVIRDAGKYIGTITRAEKLLSKNKVEGLGLSFKADDGASANYLDIYTVKPDGTTLYGNSIVQALMCCLRLRAVDEGQITFDKWDKESGRMVKAAANGYPALIGKRIGLILQKELGTHSITGEDTERLNIVTVFEAATGLVSSEILDGKTKAERVDAITKMVLANPVRDTRKRGQQTKTPQPTPAADGEFSDDIPFN